MAIAFSTPKLYINGELIGEIIDSNIEFDQCSVTIHNPSFSQSTDREQKLEKELIAARLEIQALREHTGKVEKLRDKKIEDLRKSSQRVCDLGSKNRQLSQDNRLKESQLAILRNDLKQAQKKIEELKNSRVTCISFPDGMSFAPIRPIATRQTSRKTIGNTTFVGNIDELKEQF